MDKKTNRIKKSTSFLLVITLLLTFALFGATAVTAKEHSAETAPVVEIVENSPNVSVGVLKTANVVGPTVTLQAPSGTVASFDESLVLRFSDTVTAVAGKRITLVLARKVYVYDENGAASPVNTFTNTGGFVDFTIPSGFSVNGQGNACTASITLGAFADVNTTLSTYHTYYRGQDPTRAYVVFIEPGAFVDAAGQPLDVAGQIMSNPNRRRIPGEFFSKTALAPFVYAVTPTNGATGAALSGNISVTFSKQLDKQVPGSIVLNPGNIVLAGGSWSGGATREYLQSGQPTGNEYTFADGNVYTAPYSGLSPNTEYTITVNGFKDPDGNTMTANSSYKFKTAPSAVRGRVSTYNPGHATTLRLMEDGTVKYTTTIPAISGTGLVEQDFIFSAVDPGIYSLVVTKDAHTALTLENVAVTGSGVDLTQDLRDVVQVLTLPCGDIDSSGHINSADLAVLWLSGNYNRSAATAAQPLCDLDGEGNINSADLAVLWLARNYNKGAQTIEM